MERDGRAEPGDAASLLTAMSELRAAPSDVTQRQSPSVLITNDDGIGSEGLRLLALAALEAGMRPVVAAPMTDTSGASASITSAESDGRLVYETRELAGLDGYPVYAVGALPAYIALVAARGAFGGPPDFVLSGINNGPNTGHAILHSGTVGATLTAAAHQISALAVSLGVGPDRNFATAAALARQVLPALVKAPTGTVLNLNVPDVAPDAVRGLREAPLASFGAVQTNILESGKGYVVTGFSEVDVSAEPDSDAALLADGWATLTALRPVCQAGNVDLGELVGDLLTGPVGSGAEGSGGRMGR